MLEIRAQQFAAFDQEDAVRQKRKIIKIIKKHHSDHAGLLSSLELNRRVDLAVADATKFGIRGFSGVLLFSTLAVLAGANFHQAPKFAAYLNDPLMSGDQKMTLLQNLLEYFSPSK